MKRSITNRTPLSFQAGFTLLEIMMVVAIIALLAGLAINNMGGNLDFAKTSKATADIQAFKTQLMVYESLAGFPPTTEQGLQSLVQQPSSAPAPRSWRQLMKELPADPWGTPYQYVQPGRKNSDSYDIFSAGKDRIPGTADDIGDNAK